MDFILRYCMVEDFLLESDFYPLFRIKISLIADKSYYCDSI